MPNLQATLKNMGLTKIQALLKVQGDDALTFDERTLIKSALSELLKAKAESSDDAYQAKYVQGKVYKDTVIQEDKVDDEQDEKLVKPKNKAVKPQGDNSPTAVEGQVIKSFGWSDQNALLKANTQGRNHHFSINGYYSSITQPLAKAETPKTSPLEALIVQAKDSSPERIIQNAQLLLNKARSVPQLNKSFDEKDLTRLLGLDAKAVDVILAD